MRLDKLEAGSGSSIGKAIEEQAKYVNLKRYGYRGRIQHRNGYRWGWSRECHRWD